MTMRAAARYDDHADWYVSYSRDWSLAAADAVPRNLAGSHVLDAACGWGQLSRTMAAAGAEVTGVDLSAELIAHARAQPSDGPTVRYLVGNLTDVDWWDGRPFDGAVCSMALMDVDDVDAALTTIASVLHDGAWFVFTLFHPCYPGRPEAGSLPSWPPDHGYSTEGWWTTGLDGVRGHVGGHHRMLSTYLNAAVRAGFTLESFDEPRAALPEHLIVTCRR